MAEYSSLTPLTNRIPNGEYTNLQGNGDNVSVLIAYDAHGSLSLFNERFAACLLL
jgi:hypothetical protein